jgi:glycosyltransferase involved in cell wall biosynthesis
LKNKNIPYIFDMVVNYLDISPLPYDTSKQITQEQHESTIQLIRGAIMVSAVSSWLADRASSLHPWTICIPEAVPDSFFKTAKGDSDFGRQQLRACYVGASDKSKDLVAWLEILQEKKMEISVICEKQPPRELGDIRWRKWSHAALAEEIRQNEIGLAPRIDMDNPYNKGHSSFKISSMMACGVSVMASPVPSYEPLIRDGKAGRIVNDVSELAATLDALDSDRDLLRRMSVAARERVRPLAVSNIAKRLAQFFRQAVALRGT